MKDKYIMVYDTESYRYFIKNNINELKLLEFDEDKIVVLRDIGVLMVLSPILAIYYAIYKIYCNDPFIMQYLHGEDAGQNILLGIVLLAGIAFLGIPILNKSTMYIDAMKLKDPKKEKQFRWRMYIAYTDEKQEYREFKKKDLRCRLGFKHKTYYLNRNDIAKENINEANAKELYNKFTRTIDTIFAAIGCSFIMCAMHIVIIKMLCIY